MKIWILIATVLLFIACAKPDSEVPTSVPDSNLGAEQTDFLIYDGPGSWSAEARSLKTILLSQGATYESLSPQQINELSLDDFKKYKALLFVGGDAPTVRKNLTREARENIRMAVSDLGLNYLGFCAGAWMAVAPRPGPGEDTVYGIGVVNGPILKQTFLWNMGKPFALDEAQFADGTRRKLLWYGGPVTPEIPGGVIARYSDGSPAISQMQSGKGFVIISGLHPAATKSILDWLGIRDQEAIAPEFAWELLRAVIQGKALSASRSDIKPNNEY